MTGLCDIADALPRVELAAFLYPIEAMKQAVSVLYANIIKFLLRALEWLEEGKIAHAIHSITKPAALRYDDVLDDLRQSSQRITNLAASSSQAEQRDIHQELQALTDLVKQLKADMKADQSIRASTLLECRNALTGVQLTQGLSIVSSACCIDHKATFSLALLMRDRHRFAMRWSRCSPFWISPELNTWNTGRTSSLISFRAAFKDRNPTRHTCVNIVQQLRDAGVAVLWVLRPREETKYSVVEVLKSLIYQAILLDPLAHTEQSFPFRLSRFLAAQADDEYVALLGKCLQNFGVVYIIVEANAMDVTSAPGCQKHLQRVSQKLSEEHEKTVLKVLVVSYGPSSEPPSSNAQDDIWLRVGKMPRRKAVPVPIDPLQKSVARARGRLGGKAPRVPLRVRG